MSDGTRTRGHRDHNPELYQLSYAHQADCAANLAVRGHAQEGVRRLDRAAGRARTGGMLFSGRGCASRSTTVSWAEPRAWLSGSLLGWFLPWPALIVWLCVASRLLDGWIAVGCVLFAAIYLLIWRGLRALPTDGLNQSRQ